MPSAESRARTNAKQREYYHADLEKSRAAQREKYAETHTPPVLSENPLAVWARKNRRRQRLAREETRQFPVCYTVPRPTILDHKTRSRYLREVHDE